MDASYSKGNTPRLQFYDLMFNQSKPREAIEDTWVTFTSNTIRIAEMAKRHSS